MGVCRICGANQNLLMNGLCGVCNKSFSNGTIWVLDPETMEWTKEERELKRIAPLCINHKTPIVMFRKPTHSLKNKHPKFTSYFCMECGTEKKLLRAEVLNRSANIA